MPPPPRPIHPPPSASNQRGTLPPQNSAANDNTSSQSPFTSYGLFKRALLAPPPNYADVPVFDILPAIRTITSEWGETAWLHVSHRRALTQLNSPGRRIFTNAGKIDGRKNWSADKLGIGNALLIILCADPNAEAQHYSSMHLVLWQLTVERYGLLVRKIEKERNAAPVKAEAIRRLRQTTTLTADGSEILFNNLVRKVADRSVYEVAMDYVEEHREDLQEYFEGDNWDDDEEQIDAIWSIVGKATEEMDKRDAWDD
ncbi:hypothetical protein K402DRAFT_399228 [Aulographum hederae CBS 113979]|uniref:Uncharacterized protein n=1 Tax=Aulographum hederae CBS 113979 TaxID=1176131 RepID=A0A6G1GIP2_9PEZI|nr:hypothetical protein K402DRAFT_399228 [Aulographum hederae CBS 113979]